MTSGGPGKPPIDPRTLSMIFNNSGSFNSSDFSRLLASRGMINQMNASVAARAPPTNIYESTDSAAAILRNAEFLKSLDAYRESMTRASVAANNDPAAFFRSADFLKSLDTLPKERRDNVYRSMDFLQSLDFSSTDGQKLGRDMFASIDGQKVGKEVFASVEGRKLKDYLASIDGKKPKQFKDVFSSGDWAREYKPDSGATFNKELFQSQDSVSSVSSAKSLSKMGKPLPPKKNRLKDFYTSNDWAGNYEGAHVDVDYNSRVFKSGDSLTAKAAALQKVDPPATLPVATSPPRSPLPESKPAPKPAPKPASSTNKWMKMYQAGLNNSGPPAPAQPKPAPVPVPAVASLPFQTGTSSPTPGTSSPKPMEGVADSDKPKKPKKKRIYKSRKIIPEVKTFVQFTDDDVLLGRGGLSNKHPGNKRYRQEIENAKAVYRSASKDEKTEWANLLVEYVKKYGGRFLEKDKETGQWYIIPDVVARRKAGQALREDNTPESRKAKRDRYKKAHGKL